MSFILDALRKSESERQRLGTVGVADLPLGRRRAHSWWIVGIAALLVINFVMLAFVLLRPNAAPAPAPAQAPTPQTPSPVASAAPAQPIAQAPVASTPVQASTLADDAVPLEVEYETVDRATMEAASAVPEGPTLVRPSGSAQANSAPNSIAPLRLDMHVYSPRRDGRFVLINMRKYTEGQTLQEGPKVEHITSTSVVLSYQGTQWELDRS